MNLENLTRPFLLLLSKKTPTLPKTNIGHKIGIPQRKGVSQPPLFRGYVSPILKFTKVCQSFQLSLFQWISDFDTWQGLQHTLYRTT